ncbi:MAG: fused MFS/spermidine synthase [Planctomycetota bacterium]
MKTRPRLSILKAIFFLSGGAGLIYEVVWTRVYADIVGSTALAMTAVFAAFLLLLAVGAQVVGRLPIYGRRALMLYGGIELGIALSALAASALLLWGDIWIAAHRPASMLPGLLYDFIAVALIIGPPVLLMGGTLPAILNASKALALPRDVVAQLYGWNTLGAAMGTVAAGFLLIWRLGLLGTLLTAIGVNAAVGVIALCLSRRAVDAAPEAERELDIQPTEAEGHPALWLLLAWLSGFAVLGYEVLWGRMAKFLLGDRTIAISTLLAVFIACLGLGSLLAGRLGPRFGRTANQAVGLIAWGLILAALLHMATVPLARLTIAGGGLKWLVPFTTPFARRVVTVWLLVFPPILILGAVFPLIARSARRLDATPGRVIGNLYLVNSVGAALGAFFAAFMLSRLLGTLGGFLVLSLLLAAAGAALLCRRAASRAQRAGGLAAFCICALVAPVFPRDMIELRDDETLVAAREDEYGVQVLASTKRGSLRVRNNRLHLVYELGHPQTSHAQQMAAHLTVLLCNSGDTMQAGEDPSHMGRTGNPPAAPGPSADHAASPELSMVSPEFPEFRVINVGTGYGITAGAFTLYPQVRSIETIEILPFLVDQQGRFGEFNFHYLRDPRVALVQGDGRHYLAASHERYDIISVNVLDPYLPGSSSLYTVDFWELARDRLSDGGAYTQLFWGEDVPLLVKGMRKVFPTLLFFPAYGGTSYNVVAFKEPLRQEQVRLHMDRLGPRAAAAIRAVTGDDPAAHLARLLPQAWDIQRRLMQEADRAPGRCHTDNFPILEYRWAHGEGRVSALDSPLIME